jgi:hypothetical protein
MIIAIIGNRKIPIVKKNMEENRISKILFKILFSFLSSGKCPILTTGNVPILFMYTEDVV